MGAKHSRPNLMYESKEYERRASMRTANTHNSNKESAAVRSAVSQSAHSIIVDGRQYHNVESSAYCLPNDELEQDRLNSQHFSLKALLGGNVIASVEKLIAPNPKVLDLGCGSGCWVMEMAVDHPDYQMTGVDIADMFPTTIRPENVKFELYNILDGLPYPDHSFDFVHMRLMIVALRSTDWPVVIKEIFRVLKPGGLVELVESDFTHKTNIQIVETFNHEFRMALEEAGQDPFIASKLSKLLSHAGFNVVEVEEKCLSYSLPLNPIAREMYHNWKSAMLSIKPLMAHRLNPNTDLYASIVDRYMEGITQGGWVAKIWAVCAQKQT